MDDTIEVRLPPSIQAAHDEREYNLDRVSPKTAEPRTMPDVPAATRRERDIWGTSPLDPSPRRSPATAYPNLENPEETTQKRKRSPSVEETPYRQDAQRARAHAQQHQRGESDLPRILTATETAAAAIAAASAASRTSKDNEQPEPARASAEPRDSYDLPRSREYTARPYADDEREQQQKRDQEQRERQQREQYHADMWLSRTSRDDRNAGPATDNAPYHQRSGSVQSPAEEHSGNDSRQREKSVPHASASPQSEYGANSPDDDERPPAYGAPFSPSNQKIGPPLQQTDPKRRKRNFSNRTKTGCLTCRKRKKKCDETKPECSNCVRGGFICAGYPPQKGHWGKPDPTKPTVQIESKDPTYVPPGAYGMPGPIGGLQGGTFHQQRRESLPAYRGQHLRIQPPESRPILTDDDRPTASTLPSALTSSDGFNKLSALSAFSAPANVFPTPVSAATTTPFPDRTPKEYQRVPPLLDTSRPADSDAQHLTPLPQISINNERPPFRQPSPQQNQLPPHQLQQQPPPQSQHLHHRQLSQNEPPRQTQQREHEHDREHDHAPQQHHQGQHLQQSPQQFHPQHPQHQHPAQHPNHPLRDHRSQPPLHRHQPRHPPLETLPIERQPQYLHRPYSPQQPGSRHQLKMEPAHEPEDSKEAEEARAASRRNVPFFSTVPGPRRERDEMSAGRPFYQFDNELVDLRERCAAACWKFNNSTNPNIGVSQSERTRLFKEIIQPRGADQQGPVGDQVVVDAPFHADYGYNITIGNAVHIGRNCHFSDAMPISIGNRVTIGPNVSFFTTAPSTDPMERDGVHSALQGRAIVISDDVFIGGNVTILAGVTIGKGAVVGAGSVVTSNLPGFTVSHGSPAAVKRSTSQIS